MVSRLGQGPSRASPARSSAPLRILLKLFWRANGPPSLVVHGIRLLITTMPTPKTYLVSSMGTQVSPKSIGMGFRILIHATMSRLRDTVTTGMENELAWKLMDSG